jgi:hypothetical protein
VSSPRTIRKWQTYERKANLASPRVDEAIPQAALTFVWAAAAQTKASEAKTWVITTSGEAQEA